MTAFRDYLACPYRFYLRHVAGLKVLHDQEVELDAGAFGTLLHDVLGDFGLDPVSQSSDAREIEGFLCHRLDTRTGERYGAACIPTVLLQIEQLRARLVGFSRWQADRVKEGWQIIATELPVTDNDLNFPVDGQPFYLRGRVDRIDRHRDSGDIVVIDYKSSEQPRSPDQVHRKRTRNADGDGSDRHWIDLQLPLYRHLAAAHGHTFSALGYLQLPKNAGNVALVLADWSESELAEADHTARQVVRSLRQRIFWPPTDRPPPFSEDFAPICRDGLLLAGTDEQINEVEGEIES